MSPGFHVETEDLFLIAGGYSYSRNWWDSTNRIVTANYDPARSQSVCVEGGIIVGGIASHYGHAFTDLLDRLVSLNDSAITTEYRYLAVSGPVLPSVITLLYSVAPWTKEKTLIDVSSTSISADKILNPENLSEKPFWSHNTLSSIRESIQSRLKDISASDVLYISRKNTSQRRVKNENQLVESLSKSGLSIGVLNPENLTLEMQISAFSGARIIIGAIGSGLFNLAFATNCKLVVCIVSEYYYRANGDNIVMMRSMCLSLNKNLVFLLGHSEKNDYDADVLFNEESISRVASIVMTH